MGDIKSSNSQDTLPKPPKPEPAPVVVKGLGMDVSHHNGVLDWQLIKAAGINFVFCKATEGKNFIDGQFVRNMNEARKQGILTGAYHFFRASVDGIEQAKHFMSILAKVEYDLAPVLDWEVMDGATAKANIFQAKRWLNLVEEATGKLPIIYTGPSFFKDQIGSPAGFDRYPLWIAHYDTLSPRVPAPWAQWTYWQFTETGKLAGVPGKFDLNRVNLFKPELKLV